MFFHEVSEQFYALSKESSRLVITEQLAMLLRQASPDEARFIAYFSMGTLAAPYRETQFNFAQKNVEKVLADLLEKPLESIHEAIKEAGDLGHMLMESDWPYRDEGASVNELYEKLASLQSIVGIGSHAKKAIELAQLLRSSDALCAAVICKVVAGTMRLGFSDMTFIDALSWMVSDDKALRKPIEAAYNLTTDLGYIAYVLKSSGVEGLSLIKPMLGIPIRPAAAERASSADAVIKKIGPCVVQPKLDGFRLQIHVDNTRDESQVWFFSRHLHDMSEMFPDLTREIAHVPVKSIILEGEAVAYDAQTETYLPFQVTVKRKRKHGVVETAKELPLHLFIFNMLFLNGESVLNKSQRERRVLLQEVFAGVDSSVVHLIDEYAVSTAAELAEYLNMMIGQGLEGVVAKRPDASYKAGKRNFNWIKLKRVESGHLSDTIDAVVLGYYAGKGRRAQFGIGAYLAGVYNVEKDRYETVAKVGTGLTDEGWRELKERCDQWAVAEQPSHVECPRDLVPDVWVTPEVVTVILADEITQSPVHTAGKTESESGLALRFPRFVRYADDKQADQATTVDEVRRLHSVQFSVE